MNSTENKYEGEISKTNGEYNHQIMKRQTTNLFKLKQIKKKIKKIYENNERNCWNMKIFKYINGILFLFPVFTSLVSSFCFVSPYSKFNLFSIIFSNKIVFFLAFEKKKYLKFFE